MSQKGGAMGELFSNFTADMAANSPAWVSHWVNVMSLVLFAGLPFVFFRRQARWTWLLLILGAASVLTLYAQTGYSRLLGLGHVIFWTPALIYLWHQRAHWNVRSTWFGKWAIAASVVIAISLAFDYADVSRWLLGERG